MFHLKGALRVFLSIGQEEFFFTFNLQQRVSFPRIQKISKL